MKSGKKKTILSLMRSKETTVKKKNRKKKNLAAFRSPGLELSASEDKLNDFLSSKHSSKSLKRRKRKLRGKQRHKKKSRKTFHYHLFYSFLFRVQHRLCCITVGRVDQLQCQLWHWREDPTENNQEEQEGSGSSVSSTPRDVLVWQCQGLSSWIL